MSNETTIPPNDNSGNTFLLKVTALTPNTIEEISVPDALFETIYEVVCADSLPHNVTIGVLVSLRDGLTKLISELLEDAEKSQTAAEEVTT